MPDKSKPKTIVVLLCTLEDQKFVYQTRFEVEVDKLTNKKVGRKASTAFLHAPQATERCESLRD